MWVTGELLFNLAILQIQNAFKSEQNSRETLQKDMSRITEANREESFATK